ncbi:Crp/Fnr family transcriptional regulator [Alkalibacter rhizosphaerae]|uniref:Crp/Fnr family transcriptional regulator n=1 Tax=Alkalibacter rhizosphaerae TaxID=2815577 RepID=A0A974XII7_9FIRM|nr:Crp/Fnr family transcriptional regulator [Alkalibacter rhizosphaerae]QSX09335.1 Crp/Fnr family transcriptional regulator [Alkalibacter rhizosphaerae]
MSETCKSCGHSLCARRVPIFSHLDGEQLETVVSLIRRKHFDKRETLFFEGGVLQGLMIINRGKAKAYRHTADGKEQILHLFFPGDFFGEKSLFVDKKTEYNVAAIEPVDLCMISRKDFQRLMKDYPHINQKIMEELVSRIDHLESMIENLGAKSVDARIQSLLLELGQKALKQEKLEDGMEFVLPLSREGLANYIGVTRETVSRKLSALQEEGIIEMTGNKKIRVLDVDRLERT